jgi:hypothetical protein
VVIGAALLPTAQADAACATLPQDKGRASYSVTVTTPGAYMLWVRLSRQSPDHDSVVVQVDSQCPVTVGDNVSKDGLQWVNYHDGSLTAPVTVDLTTGTHTVVLAGRETGVKVDKVLFSGDASCTPVAGGDNCLVDNPNAVPVQMGVQEQSKDAAKPAPAKSNSLRALWVATSVVAAAGALGFMAFKFVAFERMVKGAPIQLGNVVVGGEPYRDLHIVRRLLYFVRHHWLVVALSGAVVIASVIVSFVIAARPYPIFEAESGTLAGGAKIVEVADASGGKAVQFDANPAGAPTGGGSKTGGSSGGTSSGGGTSGGGGTSSGGGGSTGGCATTTSHVPGGPDGFGGCWPGANNTGVPSGTALTAYSGSCTITTDNLVLDAKTINCPGDLLIRAANVTITRSKISGHVVIDTDINQAWSLTLTDSEVAATAGDLPAIYNGNATILRANISGGHNGLECQEHSSRCSLKDSWIHDQWQAPSGDTHLGGIAHFGEQVTCTGTGSNGMTAVCFDIEHSSIVCDAAVNVDGGGCTGDLNMIAHYGPIPGAFIFRNLFGANTGASYCSYGGQAPENGATRIVYQDNVFQRGTNGICAAYGPITGFKFSNAGNTWTNNKYDNGTAIVCDASDNCL